MPTAYVENTSRGRIRAGHLEPLKGVPRPVEVDHDEVLITADSAEVGLWQKAEGQMEAQERGTVDVA